MSDLTSFDPRHGLLQYRRDVTSQWGEDGIIAEIFRRMGTQSRLCIEFGAWDGKHLSNTWDLWHNHGWNAVLIEGDPEKYAVLVGNVQGFPQVTPCRAFVGTQGENSLDSILRRLGVETPPDLLSIDIDGDDYRVFASVERFLPRVLAIEYNPTVPPELELIGAPGTRFGASARAINRLAERKGYRLAACTATNLLFVQMDAFAALGCPAPALADIMPRDHLTYVITDYDGTPYLTRQPTYAESLSSLELGRTAVRLLGGKPRPPAPPGGSLVPVEIYKA